MLPRSRFFKDPAAARRHAACRPVGRRPVVSPMHGNARPAMRSRTSRDVVTVARRAHRGRDRLAGRDHVPRLGRPRRSRARVVGASSTTTRARSPPRCRRAASARASTSRSSVRRLAPLVTAIQAVWLAGATLVCLPLPMRLGSIEEFAQQTRRRIANAPRRARGRRPRARAVPRAVEPGRSAGRARSTSCAATRRRGSAPPTTPSDSAIVQFTSGSTDDPKGVMLPHRCLVAEHRRDRRGRGARAATTSASRGCRSTTTWGSSGC